MRASQRCESTKRQPHISRPKQEHYHLNESCSTRQEGSVELVAPQEITLIAKASSTPSCKRTVRYFHRLRGTTKSMALIVGARSCVHCAVPSVDDGCLAPIGVPEAQMKAINSVDSP